jgi:hypothetical protein
MSTPEQYQSVLAAVYTTPPFRRLVALLQAEDPTETVTAAGSTRRDIAVRFVRLEIGKILGAVRVTEKAMSVK